MVRGLVPRVGAELRLWSQRPGVRHHRGPGRGQVAYNRGQCFSSQGSVTTKVQVVFKLMKAEVKASVTTEDHVEVKVYAEEVKFLK